MNKEPTLEMLHITKRFPGVVANEDVSLSLYPGEVHALLGENGAGKSTLINILAGIYFPNEGEIRYQGHRVEIGSPQAAVRLGIGMVHQHFKLVETLTAAENIALYSGACGRFLNHKKLENTVDALARQYHIDIAPGATIEQLSIGEQQRVEILKLLASGAQVLILDEPTAVLTPQESTNLFGSLREMAQQGKAVLVITHKLSEVMQFADRISVLRGGKFVGERLRRETDMDELTELMVGRRMAAPNVQKPSGKGETVLSLRGVYAKNDRGVERLKDISLQLKAGEILGIAGVSGNGQRELCEIIAGMRKCTRGAIEMGGRVMEKWSAADAIEKGVAYIPDDRIGTGLASHLSAVDNLILKDHRKPRNSRLGILKSGKIRKRAAQAVSDFDVRSVGIDAPVANMSGGNIQKLLVAREVLLDPKVIVASYPTHGLDIGAADSVHQMLLNECEKGKAVLMISEDLEELFALCSRIAVLYDGRIVDEFALGETAVPIEDVGRMMLGNTEKHN